MILFPQVKAKYDGVARLWNSLPTNAQLLQMQAMTEDEMTARVSNNIAWYAVNHLHTAMGICRLTTI